MYDEYGCIETENESRKITDLVKESRMNTSNSKIELEVYIKVLKKTIEQQQEELNQTKHELALYKQAKNNLE